MIGVYINFKPIKLRLTSFKAGIKPVLTILSFYDNEEQNAIGFKFLPNMIFTLRIHFSAEGYLFQEKIILLAPLLRRAT